jgi:hypothetical protein
MRPPPLSQRHTLWPCHCDVCQSWLECMIILYFACTVMRGGTVLYSPRDSYMRRKLLTSDSYMTQLGLRWWRHVWVRLVARACADPIYLGQFVQSKYIIVINIRLYLFSYRTSGYRNWVKLHWEKMAQETLYLYGQEFWLAMEHYGGWVGLQKVNTDVCLTLHWCYPTKSICL